MYPFNFLKVYNSVALSIFTSLCNHHHCFFLELCAYTVWEEKNFSSTLLGSLDGSEN